MISQASVQQVLQRTDIVEVIGQFLNLKRRGTNFLANCPFHNEKTPSFNVNPSKGIFKCFGCGKGGDAVTFIEEYEKFSFKEAIEWLAHFYQIELEVLEVSDEVKESQKTEESLRIINDFAAQYFENNLWQKEEGQLIGLSYFKERGLSPEIIKKFHLGYSIDAWDDFLNTALSKGYDKILLEKAGLIKIKEGRSYDNYKGRVIFPIFSNTGRILGFGARILRSNTNAPKYVNTPENELYIKNRVLYGLFQSRQSIAQLKECLLVEGYTDVISLHQGGVENVVASSGTSLTEGQLKSIAQLTKNLTILYDGDAAGIKAAMRGLEMALAESFNVKLVLLPEGEDPDSFIQKNGAAHFRHFIDNNKRDVIEFRLEVGLKEAGKDANKKSQLVNEIAETIAKINKVEDFTLQQHYIRNSATALDIEEEGLIALVNKYIRDQLQQTARTQARAEEIEQEEQIMLNNSPTAELDILPVQGHKEEWQLIYLLLEYGSKPVEEEEYQCVAQQFFDTIDMEIIEDPLARKIAEEYYKVWNESGNVPSLQHFVQHADKNIKNKVASILHTGQSPSHNWMEKYKIEIVFGEENYLAEVQSSFAYFELKILRKLLHENMLNIKNANSEQELLQYMQAHQTIKARERLLLNIVIIK